MIYDSLHSRLLLCVDQSKFQHPSPINPPPPPSPAFKIYGEYFGEYPTQLPGFDGNIFEKVNQRRWLFIYQTLKSRPCRPFTSNSEPITFRHFHLKRHLYSSERLNTSGSNFPPQPNKVQISTPGPRRQSNPRGFSGEWGGVISNIWNCRTWCQKNK